MNKAYNDIGIIRVPLNFRYSETLHSGRPNHKKFDDFYRKHPFMDVSKRAKIFAPFAALKGFDGEIAAKEVQYQPKIILDDEVNNELSEMLSDLKELTRNSRIAKENSVKISIAYFVPCSDKYNEAYGYRGQYVTAVGICLNVDDVITQTITVGDSVIPIDDIYSIEFLGD